eukprot:10682228-Ditylum_brightwellii.AAC.3
MGQLATQRPKIQFRTPNQVHPLLGWLQRKSCMTIALENSMPFVPENKLPDYLLKAGNKKGHFSINDDTKEIEDLHIISAISKESKVRFKEEEEAAIDNPCINGILVEKVGDMKITQFAVPEDCWQVLTVVWLVQPPVTP